MSNPVLTFNDRDEYQRKAIAEKIITLLTSGIGVSPLKGTFLQVNVVLEFLEILITVNELSLREVETFVKHFCVYHMG